ncbi:MAG: glycogen/starch synthase, partial [Candidatus Omnitrophica bacterium]|nr:glycogen/starch synthase [Candidatus Omnitrophota bacterium]
MKITLCSSEVVPFAKTGGLADVCGALPLALERQGHEVSIFLPKYKSISTEQYHLKYLNHAVASTKIGKNISVYFVEHENYFFRDGLYGNMNGDYPDNLERFQFFCLKTLEIIHQLNIKSDVIHCHDWQTSLIPVYLKFRFGEDSFFQKIRSVLTIHNLAYQGVFQKEKFPSLGLDPALFQMEGLEFYNQINLLKGGILYSDAVTTVSPTYAA